VWHRPKLARISCSAAIWDEGVAELGRRTLGQSRESGAFLLGERQEIGCHRVFEFAFYDDIDPHSLDTGIVHFHGDRFPVLWALCRSRGYGVVADVHVHPGGYGQSASDRRDPVMPRASHVAFILPDFAAGSNKPGYIGMYEFLGDAVWHDHSRAGSRFFHLSAETS